MKYTEIYAPLQVLFGYGVYHSNRKQIRTICHSLNMIQSKCLSFLIYKIYKLPNSLDFSGD